MIVRWIKRIIAGALTLVLLGALFVVVAIHTDWGREQIRRRVEATLRDSFPGGAKIGSIEGSILGDLVVRDLELATADGAPMVKIGRLEVRLAWRPLLGKTARIERLIADDVTLAITGAPITNEPPSPDSEPSAWSIELPEIVVRNGHVIVTTTPQPIDLDNLKVTGSLTKRAGEPMEATAGSITGLWRQRETTFDGSMTSLRLAELIEVQAATMTLKRGTERGRVKIDARKLALDFVKPRGSLEIHGDIARLVPELDLPRDANGKVEVNGMVEAHGDRIEIDANVGAAPHITRLTGFVVGDLAKRTGSAVLALSDLDLAPFTQKKVVAQGDVFVTASYGAAPKGGEAPIRAMIQAHGRWEDTPAASATISVSGTRRQLDATIVAAAGAGELKLGGRAKVGIAGSRMELLDSYVHVETSNAPLVTGKRLPIEGKLFAKLDTRGPLLPSPSLAVRGTAGGTRIAYGDLAAASVQVTELVAVIDPARFDDVALGNVHVDVVGAVQGGVPLGRAVVDAYNCDRGTVLLRETRREVPAGVPGCANRIFATITADPAAAKGTRVFAHAVVTPGRDPSQPVLDVRLDDHRMTLVTGDVWTGRGGSIVVGRDDIVRVRNVAVARGGSSIGADVDYAIATSTLTVKGDVKGLPAVAIDPAWKGMASGSLQLTKQGLRIDGKGAFKVSDLSLAPDVPILQADATIAIAGQKVSVDATAVTSQYGGARIALEIAGPRDVTDVDAWRALDRRALTSAVFTALRIDLAGAKVPTGGMVDGQVKIAGADTTGILSVSAIHTVLGDAKGDITFSPEGANVRAFTSAVIEGLGTADVNAELVLPARPFDPDAWKALGRGVLNKLVASIDEVKITPATLAALGLENQPYSAIADVRLNVVSGATTAILDFDLRNVQGGFLARPIDMTVRAEAKSTGTTGQLKLLLPSTIRSSPIDDTKRPVLAQLDLETPVTFNRWLYSPDTVGTVPLRGKFTIPELAAPTLLSVVGRKDAASGTLVGSATISGTIGTPVGHGEIVASKIQAAPSKSLRPVRLLKELKVVANWGGAAGNVTITGDEEGGGSLFITASGHPAQRTSVNGSAKITDFDLAPFAAFLPGEYAAAAGTMDAELTVRGLDKTGRVWGELHVEKASVPLHALLGTIQGCPKRGDVCRETDRLWEGARADVTLAASGEVTIGASGYLNRGKVTLEALADREFTKVTIRSLLLENVSPIHELEPVLNGSAVGTLTRSEGTWAGTITVQPNASVTISGKYGNVLLDEDAPDDLYFVDEGVPEDKYQLPSAPWLEIAIRFKDVTVKVTEFDVTAYISTQDSLRVAVGDTIGITGAIGIGQGSNAVIFNKYYVIEDGEDRIRFDGTLDPYLDIRMKHQFRGADGFEMYVTFGDRVSQTKPRFEASSSRYTEGQLFGFFLGGEPGSEAADATKSVATGAGSSIFSTVVGRRLQKRLPIKFDVIKCDFTSTATAGSSCTVGKWFGPHAFVAYKPRLEARANENRHEAQGQWYWSKRGNWLIEGTVGDRNIHGIDVLWSKRW